MKDQLPRRSEPNSWWLGLRPNYHVYQSLPGSREASFRWSALGQGHSEPGQGRRPRAGSSARRRRSAVRPSRDGSQLEGDQSCPRRYGRRWRSGLGPGRPSGRASHRRLEGGSQGRSEGVGRTGRNPPVEGEDAPAVILTCGNLAAPDAHRAQTVVQEHGDRSVRRAVELPVQLVAAYHETAGQRASGGGPCARECGGV
jgi:hypothetical protein